MERYFPELFGNDATRARLARAITDGTLPHAMILCGPKGSGRRTLARAIASATICCGAEGAPLPCGVCEVCRRIREGIHPDVHHILPEEGKASIPVGKIREMRAEMAMTASEAAVRTFIIEEAERMNTAAQNALLVSLEEPPDGVVILLLTESEEALLPTVRSRAQTVRMQLFSEEELSRYLAADERYSALLSRDRAAADALLRAAHGTIGGAQELLDGARLAEILREREVVDGIVTALCERGGAALYTAMRPLGSGKREEITFLLSLLAEALRDLILCKRDAGASLLYYREHTVAEALAERIGLARLFLLADAVETATVDLSMNANVGVVLSALQAAAMNR